MPFMTAEPRQNSQSQADRLFGEIGVRLYITTRRDLDRAIKAQIVAREAGGDPNLGEVMVGLDLLTLDQVKTILKAQEMYDDETIETLYGKLAVKNGFITKADLKGALRIQERTGRRLRIGEVLVKKGYVTWAQHEALLRAQQRIFAGVAKSEKDKGSVKLKKPKP